MEGGRLPSLELVERTVREERAAQLTLFDALDSRAGVILGFAGVLIALPPVARSLPIGLGKLSALASAACSIAAFWPRRFWNLDLRELRDRYLMADPRFAEVRLMDTMIAIARRNEEVLALRGRLIKVAMSTLGVAALLIALGAWLH